MSVGSYQRDEMQVAAELQRRLNPVLDLRDDIDIAAWSMPCDQIGGDYYDVHSLGEGKHLLLVGDASGHGLPAAMVMIDVRSAFLSLLDAKFDLVEIFEMVNRRIFADIPLDRFMTLFAGIVDTKKRTLHYCSAGHDSPIWYRPSRGDYIKLRSTGTPIGMVEKASYRLSPPIALQGGDIILFGTDGIWEAQSPQGQLYGLDRLAHCLESCSIADATILSKLIQKDVVDHIGDTPHSDDITLMVTVIK